MSSEWIENRLKVADKIKQIVPKDRLGYVEGCIQCIAAIGQSNQGWLQWLSNPTLMNEFEEETLKGFFEKLRHFALEYLAFDIDATKKGLRPSTGGVQEKPYG